MTKKTKKAAKKPRPTLDSSRRSGKEMMLAMRAEIDRLTAELAEARKAPDAKLLLCDRHGCGKERPPYAWMSSSKGERKYCCFGCMELDRADFLASTSEPVTPKPAPDNTRELVAELADYVARSLDDAGNCYAASCVEAIAAQLRGGA